MPAVARCRTWPLLTICHVRPVVTVVLCGRWCDYLGFGRALMAGRPVPMQFGGVEVLVETRSVPGTEQTSALDKAQERMTDALERAKATIVAVGESTVDVIARLSSRAVHPEKVEVEFGLGFSAKGAVIVAEASAEATLKVKLVYELPKV